MNTKTQRKRVLFFITSGYWGGAQQYVYDLAVRAYTEYDVHVILGDSGSLGSKLEEAGVSVSAIDALTRRMNNIAGEWRAFLALIKELRRYKPDVFHINSSKAGVMGVVAGRVCGVPNIIFTAHGWAFNEARPLWQRILIKVIMYMTVLMSHRTITVSDAVRLQLNFFGIRKKMQTIYNGRTVHEPYTYSEAREKLIARDASLYPYKDTAWIIQVGELHPTKQHEVMLYALREVIAVVPDVQYLIVGSGTDAEEKNLKEIVESLNLNECVHFLGAVADAARYMPAGEVVVMPSRTEALPYVPIEACITGVPVVASAVGGIPEIIRDDVEGRLVPSGNHSELAAACIAILTDDALRARYAAAARVRGTAFNPEYTYTETCKVYRGY